MVVYFVLFFLLYMARTHSMRPQRHQWILPLFLTIAYAMTDEFHQSNVPGRTATLRDILYDTYGAVLAMLVVFRKL